MTEIDFDLNTRDYATLTVSQLRKLASRRKIPGTSEQQREVIESRLRTQDRERDKKKKRKELEQLSRKKTDVLVYVTDTFKVYELPKSADDFKACLKTGATGRLPSGMNFKVRMSLSEFKICRAIYVKWLQMQAFIEARRADKKAPFPIKV